MRRLSILLFSCCGFFMISSCSKNHDAQPATGLAGDWKVIALSYTGVSETNLEGMSVSTPFTAVGTDLNMVLHFSVNPNIFKPTGSYKIMLHMNVAGQDMQYPFEDPALNGAATWQASGGNTLVITTTDGEAIQAELEEKDRDSWIMSFHTSGTEMESGIPVKLNMQGTFTLQKL